MSSVLSVVNRSANAPTVQELEAILARAKAGEVIGLAYVYIGQDGEYSGNVVGVAATLPIYLRGLVEALKEQISKSLPL